MFSVLDKIVGHGFEQVAFFEAENNGCTAIVAVHNTALGPALGGCRMNLYSTKEEALFDVARLAEGMSYKSSLAGLNLGGGKAVLIADRTMKTGREKLFENFGRCVESLGGRYYTAEDVGTSVEDMSSVMKTCRFVAGRDPALGGGGDPSPHTAQGVFYGIQACLERVFGSPNLQNRRVMVQGVGHVGKVLVRLLSEAGAIISLSDVNALSAAEMATQYNAKAVPPEKSLEVECDVLSPCAMGGVLNIHTLPQLRTKIIAGAANNQILGDGIEEDLQRRNILYAPDFAINAGGVILCADELEPGGANAERVSERVKKIYSTVASIIDQSKSNGETPGATALRIARERIDAARRKNKPQPAAR